MTLRSRIEKLEASAQDVTRVQKWYWNSMPDRLELSGEVLDRLPGETDEAMIDRVSRLHPQVEFTIFRWVSQEAGRE